MRVRVQASVYIYSVLGWCSADSADLLVRTSVSTCFMTMYEVD